MHAEETAMQSGSENTAHLKGKLNNLTDTCRVLSESLGNHKKEVQILRSEKETLENVLTMKCQDTRKALTNELHRVQEDINRHYNVMRAESVRLNQQLGTLKTEKSALEKEIIRMTNRIVELEDTIGKDSDEDNL
jgi:chromosome segregation ATPase